MYRNLLIRLVVIHIVGLFLFSCGKTSELKPSLSLSGHVVLKKQHMENNAPVFIAVLDRSPTEAGSSFGDSLVAFQAVDRKTMTFKIDLSEKGLNQGNTVYLVVFAVNSVRNGIPFPETGDLAGLFIDTDTFSPSLVLQNGGNTGIEISLDREVFDFDASVSGKITGDGQGVVTVFAYAGDITTFEVSGISTSEILGYTRVFKSSESEEYKLSILPYGKNIPIHNVYIMAFFDRNNNGVPDAGDLLGFHSDISGFPELITVDSGHFSECNISFSIEIPEPSGFELRMEGTVEIPGDIEPLGKNIFILVVKSGENLDLSGLLNGDFSSLAYFCKLDEGQRDFSFDLSDSGLAPGDKVMVLALYNSEYTAGFPRMKEGSLAGYFQNTKAMSADLTLKEGINRTGLSDGTDFKLNRVLTKHDSSIRFKLDDTNLRNSLNVSLDPGEHVTVVAVYKDGVHIGQDPVVDMDYIIGFGSFHVPATGNTDHEYTLDLLPVMNYRIPVMSPFAVEGVYVFAVFDGNLNNGPSKNNYIGFYWKPLLGLWMEPKEIVRLPDGETVLDRTVRFLTRTL